MKLELIPLDEGFSEEAVVTDPRPVNERFKTFNPDSIFSERIFGRMPSSGREYSCDCGKTEGRFYENQTCASCGSAVTCRDTLFSKRGWIDLGEYRVISPLFYHYLKKAIGNAPLVKILRQQRELTVDGLPKETGHGPNYENLGMDGFYERFDEVINHFRLKKKSDQRAQAYFDLVQGDEHRDKVFTTKVPIFSQILRPALIQGTQIVFDEVNNVFTQAVALSNALKDLAGPERTESKVNSFLWLIQEKVIEVMEHVLQALSGKKGYLRSSLLGVRVNFSGRSVIVPHGPGKEMDEVSIPYLKFLELYRFQLCNVIARLRNVSLARANAIWYKAQTEFDHTVYKAMKEMIRLSGEGLYCILNRNPTIAWGSILRVRVTDVKDDMSDLTMSISNNILKLLGGDYDGRQHCRR